MLAPTRNLDSRLACAHVHAKNRVPEYLIASPLVGGQWFRSSAMASEVVMGAPNLAGTSRQPPRPHKRRGQRRGCCSSGPDQTRRVNAVGSPRRALDDSAKHREGILPGSRGAHRAPLAGGSGTDTDEEELLYHSAGEDFDEPEPESESAAGMSYRGFSFPGPVPPSVTPARDDKPFGSSAQIHTHPIRYFALFYSFCPRVLLAMAKDCQYAPWLRQPLCQLPQGMRSGR